jgi:hypothetical protein
VYTSRISVLTKTVPRHGKIPHQQHDSVSHREGNCIASLRAKREPGARETMLETLRQLTQQVREDDSLH